MRRTLISLAGSACILLAVHRLLVELPMWAWLAFGVIAAGRVVVTARGDGVRA